MNLSALNPSKITYLFIVFLLFACISGSKPSGLTDNQEEFYHFIDDLGSNYIYLDHKVDVLKCIESKYSQQVNTLKSPYDKVLFYEAILNEFCDSHISLNTNTDKSYRLRSPIYVQYVDNQYVVKNVFTSQIKSQFAENIIGAKVVDFNGLNFSEAVASFPSICNDKSDPKTKEWLANKVISGKRNEKRVLKLGFSEGRQILCDIDSLELQNSTTLLQCEIKGRVGYIRINNALGNSGLVEEFDRVLETMSDTEAIILDLRNTPNGGSSSIAEPIMGRFISERSGYQICESKKRKYTKYIKPTGRTYANPLYVIVGRWTGSMGEGMAIGFDGIGRAKIIGTEMNRLGGGIKTIDLLNSNFGFNISFEKLYHTNGTLRELFVPQEYVIQSNLQDDAFVDQAMELIASEKKK